MDWTRLEDTIICRGLLRCSPSSAGGVGGNRTEQGLGCLAVAVDAPLNAALRPAFECGGFEGRGPSSPMRALYIGCCLWADAVLTGVEVIGAFSSDDR